MPTTRATIDALVVHRIQDTDSKLSQANRDAALAAAVSEYERTFPLEVVVKVAGLGGSVFDYLIEDNFPDYVDGFSFFTQIVYPYVTTDANPRGLDADQYQPVRLDTGLYLRFRNVRPTASEFFLVSHTGRHTLDDVTSTIPASDEQGLADLGASYCSLMLAQFYAQTTEGTLQADSANRGGRVDFYKSLAREHRRSFEEKLGLNRAERPGLAVADINPPFSSSRGDRLLFHD